MCPEMGTITEPMGHVRVQRSEIICLGPLGGYLESLDYRSHTLFPAYFGLDIC